jgi:hypothetical protein
MDRAIDYGQDAVGEGGNYWALEHEVRRVSPETGFAWADSGISDFGETVARDIASNADTVDDRGPVLETDDRDGDLANAVDYHPAHLANERRRRVDRPGDDRRTRNAGHRRGRRAIRRDRRRRAPVCPALARRVRGLTGHRNRV